MDGGACWATVHRAATSWTRLKRLGAHARVQVQARPRDAVVSKPGMVPALGVSVARVGTMPLKRFLRLKTKTKLLTALSRGPLGSQASWAHGHLCGIPGTLGAQLQEQYPSSDPFQLGGLVLSSDVRGLFLPSCLLGPWKQKQGGQRVVS